MSKLPSYQPARSYAWNYQHAPDAIALASQLAEQVGELKPMPGDWNYCGLKVASPLGVPAGPLLNGKWCLYYAALGFDVVTYKTVRSIERACYDPPNLVPVDCGHLSGGKLGSGQLQGGETNLHEAAAMTGEQAGDMPKGQSGAGSGTWAVAFGMPSMSPDVWRKDIEWTRKQLPKEKVLAVSVVGSVQPGWTLDDLARDYAQCACWAADAGADVIEANFSCPNVQTCDGQLYQHPQDAALVAAQIKASIGRVPLVIKVGKIDSPELGEALIDALAPHISALAMTNSIAATVTGRDGQPRFGGERRGICGDAIRAASIAQTAMMALLLKGKARLKGKYREPPSQTGIHGLQLIGVGGASTAEHVRQYLSAGAGSVHLATAAMLDPLIAVKIRRAW